MQDAGTTCPSDDLLSSYLAGALAGAAMDEVAEHLSECVTCSAVVELTGGRAESVAASRRVLAAGALGSSPQGGAAEDLRAGDTLGRYVISHRIGAGGMGVVWAAYDPALDRQVAIKVMRSDSASIRARFEREVSMTARLQHPSIVGVIEAGSGPTGAPFYVMELVRGEPLDRVLASTPALTDRLQLLPRIMVVAEAVAYAHDLGIIHRDLKPQNVLLGEFGETVVIDWGLAKALRERDGDQETAAASAPEHTALGAVIGTPAYMAIEQARGEEADARSDVYALGAMLYHVLAGCRPYDDVDGERVLEAVLSGPPRPLRAHALDLPGDLVSIVDKAMAREASDRHPSARELAADLRQFHAGELVASHRYTPGQIVRRWVRRHRAALAVGCVASLTLLVVGVLSIVRIAEEKRHAEERRAQAEELVDFIVFDLHDKLKGIGRIDILGDAARKAQLYRLDEGGDALGAEAMVRRSAVLSNLAEVVLDEGDVAGALSRYRDAMGLARSALDSDPGNAKWRRHLAKTGASLGDALLTTGDADGALSAYRDSMKIVEALAAEAPGDPQRQIDLAHVHGDLTDAYVRKQDGRAALQHAREGLALAEEVVAAHPADARWRYKLAMAHMSVGRVLIDQSLDGEVADLALAEVEYGASAAILRQLESQEPPSPDRQTMLAGCLRNLGIVREGQGDLAGALASYRESAAVVEKLAAEDPADAYAKRDLAAMHYQIGKALAQKGEPVAAAREFEQGIAVLEPLAAGDPSNNEWQLDLAWQWYWLGHVQLSSGQMAEGERALRAGQEIVRRGLAAHPDSAAWAGLEADVRAQLEWVRAARDAE